MNCFCSLCQKNLNEPNVKVVAGEQYSQKHEPMPFYICDNCVQLLAEAINSKSVDNSSPQSEFVLQHTPQSIVSYLNEYVVGQEEAKKAIAVAIYNHYKRISNPQFNGVEIDKSNVLMIGPTGSGKTLIVKTVAKLLDLPFAIVDATSLTEAGYVGDDVETILQRLLQCANGDIKKAEKGIIFIDEIDKIGKRNSGASITRDVSGEGVQQALLKILEGTISRVQDSGSRKHSQSSVTELDTSNILFICGGAFVGIDKIIEKKVQNNKTIGFINNDESQVNLKNRDLLKQLGQTITPDDLSTFGLIPEFIGRLPVIVELQELSREDLLHVVTEPKNAPLRQMQAMFKLENVELTFSENALNQIVDLTLERKTGARGIRAIFETILKEYMFIIPEDKGIKSITFNDIYSEPLIQR